MHIGWPAALRLAVCVDRDGGCVMLVYHRDEEPRILARVAEAIQQPIGAFCVVPERAGCPTRRMLFSEEQRLLSLVADAAGLLETAEDYAINYAFASEEGLDSELLTTGAQVHPPLDLEAAHMMARHHEPEVSPEAGQRFLPRNVEARAPKQDPIPQDISEAPSGVPEGFRALTEDERRSGLFVNGVLSIARSGKVVATIGRAGTDLPGIEVATPLFRDDLLCFIVPISELRQPVQPPLRLVFDPALFPAAMIASLESASQGVRITASGGFLYVHLLPSRMPHLAAPSRKIPEVPAGIALPRPLRFLRVGLGGGAAALAVLLALRTSMGPVPDSAPKPPSTSALRAEIFAASPFRP